MENSIVMSDMSETGNINITSEILQFKEAVRNIWNSYFLNQSESNYVASFDNFKKIEASLFWAIVVSPLKLDLEASNFREKPFDKIQVIIKNNYPEFTTRFGKLDLNNNIVWSVSNLIKSNENMILRFCDFFDWSPYDFVDYSHIRCFIENFPESNENNNQYCLIETRYVEFVYGK